MWPLFNRTETKQFSKLFSHPHEQCETMWPLFNLTETKETVLWTVLTFPWVTRVCVTMTKPDRGREPFSRLQCLCEPRPQLSDLHPRECRQSGPSGSSPSTAKDSTRPIQNLVPVLCRRPSSFYENASSRWEWEGVCMLGFRDASGAYDHGGVTVMTGGKQGDTVGSGVSQPGLLICCR